VTAILVQHEKFSDVLRPSSDDIVWPICQPGSLSNLKSISKSYDLATKAATIWSELGVLDDRAPNRYDLATQTQMADQKLCHC
jgi:hypothetical protein